MIDLANETMLTMNEALCWLEERTGHRFGRSTIYRWTDSGIDGHILETIRVGGSRFTSVEALIRWIVSSGGELDSFTPAMIGRRQDDDRAEARRRAEELFG